MVLVFLKNGDCIEVENAAEIETQDSALVCLSENGQELARFAYPDVEAYTADEHYVALMQEELCDEEHTYKIDDRPASGRVSPA